MNKNLITLMGIIFATLISGCTENSKNEINKINDSKKEETGQSKALDLSGKSIEEVLALKYNKAELSCALWAQRNKELDLTARPNDSFVWDLKANSNMPQTFKLSGNVENYYKINIDILVSEAKLYGSHTHTDSKGNIYSAKYTPYFNYGLRYEHETSIDLRPNQNLEISKGIIYEKNVTVPMNLQWGSTSFTEDGTYSVSYHDHVECVINTEIKPEYLEQSRKQVGKSDGGISF